jgi:voltage-gated potassium channel
MKFSLGGVFALLDAQATGPGTKIARIAHQLAIAIGVLAMVLSSEPDLSPAMVRAASLAFWTIAGLFAVEYVIRLAIAPYARRILPGQPWRARWEWATSFLGLVDFAGSWPVLALAAGMDRGPAMLFGALWLAKLAPYAAAFELIGRVLKSARGPLTSLLLGFVTVLLVAATLAHIFEGAAQPDKFGTIRDSLWWAIVTLTTTGYGDAFPVTTPGRIVAGFVMLSGIAVLAMWAGILATTFEDEMRRRNFLKTWDLVSQVPFFEGLGAGLIAEVARLLKPRKFYAGAPIMRSGDAGDCMYFIVSGQVGVQLSDRVLTIGDGSFIGEMALISGAPRTATVLAQNDCELLELDLADFRDLAARHPELKAAIVAEAERRTGK